MDEAELREVARFVHRVHHLRWRKGLGPVPEGDMVCDCWMPYEAPDWAMESAKAGEPGSRWCPLITPSLTEP